MDADEYLNSKPKEVKKLIGQLSKEVSGIQIKRKIIFQEKEINYGGWYPKWNLRFLRNGFGECENKWMDEHIILKKGVSIKLDIDIVDHNLNSLDWWLTKHISYANREAINYFISTGDNKTVKPNIFGNKTEKLRWMKEKYKSLPLFLRPFFVFTSRYFFKAGFLDGRRGFIWHVLQGFWYRFLVDVKIFEIKRKFKHDKEKITAYIKQNYQIKD